MEVIEDYFIGTGVTIPKPVKISISDGRLKLVKTMDYFLNVLTAGEKRKAEWMPCYDEVVNWIGDNKGRGLLMIGGCGLGKTLLGMYAIPFLLRRECKKVVSAFNADKLWKEIDDVLKKHIIYLDDIGTESVANQYGNKRVPFAELCDAVEKEGKLLIASTNLTVEDLSNRYGERTIDRLRGTTKIIPFIGKSKRG